VIRLYQFRISPFCAKIRKILEFKGLEYEAIEVDYVERKELAIVSGQITVPVLTFDDGRALVDSERIALALEEAYPEPTLFPPTWRGLHLALARYFDTELGEVLFRAAVPEILAYYRRRGPDQVAFWRLIRERKYGTGFIEQMIREHSANCSRARELLAPLDESLGHRPFLLGRIGYADFALYGQLSYLALGSHLAIATDLPNIRAFFERVDRMSSALET